MLILGMLVIVGTYVDALWTTVTLRGAGPATKLVCRLAWGGLRSCPRRWHRHLLPLGGSLCLLAGIALWVILLWLGWFLVFSSDPGAVVDATTHQPAETWQRAYYVGFAISTLGVGDFVADGQPWLIATTLAALSGLFLVTLSITYILPVLSAATEKHQLGALLHDLGDTPEDLIRRWHKVGFDQLVQQALQTLTPQLHLHAQRHLAYPVIHHFRSARQESALAVNLAIYDQALSLLACALPESERMTDDELAMLRAPVTALLDLSVYHVKGTEAALPAPRLDALRSRGMALVSDSAFETAWAEHVEHRRRMTSFVASSGWMPAGCW